MIYLDSAATSYYRPREVAQAVCDAILTMGNAGRGSHTSSLNSARMIYETRCLLNELFHGPGPEQVVFTSNATEALNIAIQGLTAPGVRMAATAMDHNSVLRPCIWQKREGAACRSWMWMRRGGFPWKSWKNCFKMVSISLPVPMHPM